MAENEVRTRLRRTNSTSRAEDIVTEDAKVRTGSEDFCFSGHCYHWVTFGPWAPRSANKKRKENFAAIIKIK